MQKNLSPVPLSPIVAGMWRLNEWHYSDQQLATFINQCVELEVSTFDHADIYGGYTCQKIFGKAWPLTGLNRSDIQLVSKCGICLKTDNKPEHRVKHYNTSYQHIIASCENSLQELQTEYLDLLLIHRPDPLLNAEEVARAFEQLRSQGKIVAAGVSNFLPHQIELLRQHTEISTNQIELSLLASDSLFNGTIEEAQQNNMPLMIWSPLAGGQLFDKTKNAPLIKCLEGIAERYQTSIDTLCYAWFQQLPTALHLLTGSGKIERIQAATEALDINIERQDWYLMLEAAMGAQLP